MLYYCSQLTVKCPLLFRQPRLSKIDHLIKRLAGSHEKQGLGLLVLTCSVANSICRFFKKNMYQFKVKLENEKCGLFFIEASDFNSFDYSSLVDRVRSFSSQLRNVDNRQLRLCYLDDEDTFVHLLEDAGTLVEMYFCSVAVKNADFKRIPVKVEESSSPVSVALIRCGNSVFPINQGLKLEFFVSIQVDTRNIKSGIHPEKHSIPDLDTKYSICSIQQGKTCFAEKQVLYNLHFSNNMYLFQFHII